MRNRYGEAIAKGEKPVSLKAGTNALSMPLAGLEPYAGPLALEAVLRDGEKVGELTENLTQQSVMKVIAGGEQS